ncbi:MAG: VWA domain-containing protein, partial [Delftia sp.]|nr:VWA domain-containing protein [Delftia sp.]
MSLLEPGWLVLAVPCLLALWWWRPPRRSLLLLRGLLLALVVAAMARPVIWTARPGSSVVVVADRSRSLPADSEQLQQEIIARLSAEKAEGDRLAVVSFAATAAVEAPLRSGRFGAFVTPANGEGSNLEHGLRLALAQLPVAEPGRLLVLSDGRWTGSDPASAAAHAATRGVAIDTLLLQRAPAGDLAIDRLAAPTQVATGESFMISAWLRSPVAQEITYSLRRHDTILATGTRSLAGGRTRLLFRDRARTPGTNDYTIEITGSTPDPTPENNSARLLVTARGRPQLLHVATRQNSGLARLLAQTGIAVTTL